jgi:hypothetical protein
MTAEAVFGAALYGTIWMALVLFVLGERPGAWRVSLAGLALAVVHTVLAMGGVHGWSHARAVTATARQTEAVYGLAWGGGVFVNYALLGVWTWHVWRRARRVRPAGLTGADVLLRGVFFIILFNAAVIFAAGWRRVLGVVVCAALLGVWGQADVGGRRPPTS